MAIAKAIAVDDRNGRDVVRQNAKLGGYCTAKYTLAIAICIRGVHDGGPCANAYREAARDHG